MKEKKYLFILLITLVAFATIFIFTGKLIYARNPEGRILFTSQGYLWAVTPDGEEEEKLCDISIYKKLVLSPNKKQLAGIKEKDVFIMDWNGKRPLNITRSPEIEVINGFSPYGEKIICALKNDPNDITGFLGIARTDGTAYTKIKEYYIKESQDIGWSPDREKITFTCKNVLYTIPFKGDWVNSLGGEKVKKLTPYNPSWSPDGTRIAFRANSGGIGDLWLINAESEEMRPVYLSECHSEKSPIHSARWSPKGNALLFEAPHPTLKENNIYIIFADGSSLKLLGKGLNPEWSPDSRKVICRTEDDNIRIFDTGLSGYNSSRKIYPSFYSPDLLKVVYSNKNTKEAWMINLETKEKQFVTGGDVTVLGWIED